MGALERNRLFDSLTPSELPMLESIGEKRTFAPGQQIFTEGDQGDGLYIVVSGAVQISALVTTTERRVLNLVKAGDFFGEMAVVDGEPRSASATAAEATESLFFPREKMSKVIENSPRLAMTLVREFSQRMREVNRRYVHEVLQAERLTVVGRFARSIVHDFKNPLHVIGLAAEIIELESVPVEMRKNATLRIRKQVERLSNMVSELLEFIKTPERNSVLPSHSLSKIAGEILDDLTPEIGERGVQIVVRQPAPDITLPLDPKRLLHVFSNLLHNAVEAVQGNGTIFISFAASASEIVTEIEDTGKGIAPEIMDKLFEPFATHGKAKGSGLGLSICKKIVEDHGGWIRASNRPGGGAIFAFGLPRNAS